MPTPSLNSLLLPNEIIRFKTKKHLIIFFIPMMLAIFSFYTFFVMRLDSILTPFRWLPFAATLFLFLSVTVQYLTCVYIVTNQRIIMREGFFYRRLMKLKLNAVMQINVDQSLLGQGLGYGTVSIHGLGAFDVFSLIANPFLFQQNATQTLKSTI